MNVWIVIVKFAKIALWVILSLLCLVGFSSSLTDLINIISERKRLQENTVFNTFIFLILEIISLMFLLSNWF